MKTRIFTGLSLLLVATSSATTFASENPLDEFRDVSTWKTAPAAHIVDGELKIADRSKQKSNVIYNSKDGSDSDLLVSKKYLADSLVSMEYLLPTDSEAVLFLQGRYAVELEGADDWQDLRIEYRAPRFDAARNKTADAMALEIRVNGEVVKKNQLFRAVSSGAAVNWEGREGSPAILAKKGDIALRKFDVRPTDYGAVVVPEKSGQPTNEDELVDFVALGETTFQSVGCNVCHSTKDEASNKSGPTLYGLFRPEARDREVVEGEEKNRFIIKADREYLFNSIREPANQLAVAESGAKEGTAYPPLMPPFSEDVLTDTAVEAIGAYLATLNDPQHQGPVIMLMPEEGRAAYDPLEDDLQLLVDDQTRIQRGPMPGVSGRAVHVGQVNSVNYSFDPRTLAIAKLWQGGFLDMSGEFKNRGGNGLELGYKSREIDLGSSQMLFAPLRSDGETVDFSFKEAKFGDTAAMRESLYSEQDHLGRVAAEDAQFLGYRLNSKSSKATPEFRYRVEDNLVAVQTSFAADGKVTISVTGELKKPQSFLVNTDVISDPETSAGELKDGRWQLAAGTDKARLTGRIGLAREAWHPPASDFEHSRQPLRTAAGEADMPNGYRIENYYPPKDNFGREQLFEALGLAIADDGTIVVATRTAGVWRIVDGQWRLFAEGTFDALGVQIEDKKGLQIVVGQKAELTRISDTNGDGLADNYETLFDAHSYHGNYHTYMHGPVRGRDGAYYIGLNLAHADEEYTYKANGQYMGSMGGLSGWSIRVEPDGEFQTWANGHRSPAGMGLSPAGNLWYAENQGEYVGTSKLFMLEEGKFYGNPSGLVDLPGMTPDSDAIKWENVADQREQAVVLFPHNKVANSPGHPAWDTTQGKFGPFAGQMLIGDQTQSNLLRVDVETVNGVKQGSVMPFVKGLQSGAMRPLFLEDGSVLLGQTGRGWQAKGGHLASLQRVYWDGETVPAAIHSVRATKGGFVIQLTQPLQADVDGSRLEGLVAIDSWVYRDAPDYGSPEMDVTQESIAGIAISNDRKQIDVELAQLEHDPVHPQQTARVYHLVLDNQQLFQQPGREKLEAYYTLHTFAK